MAVKSLRFEDPRTVLKRYGLFPKRSWGQNFLVSSRARDVIARACVDEPRRQVIEIGAGLGTLTRALLDLDACVVAVEQDREMCDVLISEFSDQDNFELKQGDATKIDYASCLNNQPGIIAGNLPYQVTGRILRRVIEESSIFLRAVFMVQKEVANRIIAPEGDKARGALSVFVQSRFKPRILLRLGPGAFHPKPKVHSAVVELHPHEHAIFDSEKDQIDFDRGVKAAFSARRKTLRNALVGGGLGSVDEVMALLARAGIDPGLRPGRLSVEDFVALGKSMLP